MMPHIAILDYIGKKAGMNDYDRGLATALAKKGAEVTVYSNFDESSFSNASFVNCFPAGSFSNPVTMIQFLIQFNRVLQYCKRKKVDVVLLHVFNFSGITYRLIRRAKRKELKVFVIVHDVESLIENDNVYAEKILTEANEVFLHNEFSKQELIRLTGTKGELTIFPHGHFLDVPERFSAIKDSEVNKSLTLFTLLFFGMIKPSKGIDLLIEAMKQLPDDIHLIIAGRVRNVNANVLRKKIMDLELQDRIQFEEGFVTDEKRHIYFNKADAIVLPYLKIYQSGVLMLALSYGLPVVVSDLLPNKEIIQDDVNGYLFSSGSVESLVNTILEMRNDSFRENKIQSGKDFLIKHHDWSNAAEKILDKCH